jgi:filamentous hemagglutinin
MIKTMSPEQAALNTWTGQLAKDHGFGNVASIQERFGDIVVIFGK